MNVQTTTQVPTVIQSEEKMRVYKDKQTRLWRCQSGLIVGVGTTERGAYENLQTRMQCPLTLLLLQKVQ